MTRLNPDNLANLLPIEAMFAEFGPAAVRPVPEPFDLFLQRAGRATEPERSEPPLDSRPPPVERERDRQDPARPRAVEPKPPRRPTSESSSRDSSPREPSTGEPPRPEPSKTGQSSADVQRDVSESSDSQSDATSPQAKAGKEADAAQATSDSGNEGEKKETDKADEVGLVSPVAALLDPEKIASAKPTGQGEEDGQTKQGPAVAAESSKNPAEKNATPLPNVAVETSGSQADSQVAKQPGADLSAQDQPEAQAEQQAASADAESEPAQPVGPSNDQQGSVLPQVSGAQVLPAEQLAGVDPRVPNSERQSPTASRQQSKRRVATKETAPPTAEATAGVSAAAASTESALEGVDLGPQGTTSDATSPLSETPAAQVGDESVKTNPAGKSENESTLPGRVASNEHTRPAAASREHVGGVEQADRVRFVQRVTRAFQSIANRGGSIRLRLHPPELGVLNVEVTVRHGMLTARMEAETNAARTILLDNLPALRDRLAEQNIKVDSFDVGLMGQSGNDSPQLPSDQGPSHDGPAWGDSSSVGRREDPTEKLQQDRAVARPGEGSQLDVVV